MIDLKRVLIPTDFSDYSAEGLKYGCALAEKFEAEIHLLHVLEMHPSTTPTFGGGLALTNFVQESKEAANQALSKLPTTEWSSGRSIVRATADGSPFVEIIRYAKDNDIDLIVMGTHGRSGLTQMLIGGVAEKVVRKSPCPVLTVRPSQHAFVMP